MITDYAELVAEVTERSGVSGVANRATQFVGMAEDYMRKALRVGSVGLVDDIPPLATANTNWFLELHSEAYIQAVLFQVYQAGGDFERGSVAKGLLDQSLDVILHNAKLAAVKGHKMVTPK